MFDKRDLDHDSATPTMKDGPTPQPAEFDFSSYPTDTLFHDRRGDQDRRSRTTGLSEVVPESAVRLPRERRQKKERRHRINPTTFEKQYTNDEMEFMNAMQRFKVRSGKSFPSHGEVLMVASELGYHKVVSSQVGIDSEVAARDETSPVEGDQSGATDSAPPPC